MASLSLSEKLYSLPVYYFKKYSKLDSGNQCTNTRRSCDSHLTVSLGTAEVNEFDDALGGDHDVGTFDVTVNDAIVVEVV